MGASRFNGGGCFLDGGASFLSRGFDGVGVFEKKCKMGGAPHMPPTMGNPGQLPSR